MNTLYMYRLKFFSGFAPNFGTEDYPICTLACCKGGIRNGGMRRSIKTKHFGNGEISNGKSIADNDVWILGLAGVKLCKNAPEIKFPLQPLYLMKVTNILSFSDYYNDPIYTFKKYEFMPEHFDNFYDSDKYLLPDGSLDIEGLKALPGYENFDHKNYPDAMKKDLKGGYVLISDHFYDFGFEMCDDEIKEVVSGVKFTQGYAINKYPEVKEYFEKKIDSGTLEKWKNRCGRGKNGRCCK